MPSTPAPELARVASGAVSTWVDLTAKSRLAVLVAFSERGGGVSSAPYASLNLASHVGDDSIAVDSNRLAWLEALGISASRERLTMAEQVHGSHIVHVGASTAGSGAFAHGGAPPVAGTDALFTDQPGVPIALCFADCVPVVLVGPGPTVAVVHAGWRGALASLPGATVSAMGQARGFEGRDVTAYIGAHIGACHYEVDDALMSQFVNTFGTVARAQSGGLDLDAVVTTSLQSAGVASCNIARLGVCTAEATDRFFSYRAEGGVTGRHAALVCIL